MQTLEQHMADRRDLQRALDAVQELQTQVNEARQWVISLGVPDSFTIDLHGCLVQAEQKAHQCRQHINAVLKDPRTRA